MSIGFVQFEIYLEDVYYGEGEISSFKATREPSSFTIDVFLENIGGTMYVELADLVLLGHSKVITIRITTVKTIGITVNLNQDIDVVVAQEDILF